MCYIQSMGYRKPTPCDVYIPDPIRIQHDRIVVRSRHFHDAIAEKLRANPEFLSVAKAHLKRWMDAELEDDGLSSKVFLDWKKNLSEKSLEEIVQLLLSKTQNADRLRSSSPFCDILTEEEYSAISKAHATVTA